MDATSIITQIFLPISLAIIMFGMGLTLVIGDFARLFTYPKEVLLGLCNQLIFLPLIGFLIILLFDLNSSMVSKLDRRSVLYQMYICVIPIEPSFKLTF